MFAKSKINPFTVLTLHFSLIHIVLMLYLYFIQLVLGLLPIRSFLLQGKFDPDAEMQVDKVHLISEIKTATFGV